MPLRRHAALFALVCAFVSSAGEPNPAELVQKMHEFCSRLNSVACEIDFLRVSKVDNHRREMELHFDVALKRPNLLSIQMKADNSVTYAWISDGADTFVYMWGAEKYTQNKAAASLSELLVSEESGVVRRALDNAFLLDTLLDARAKFSIPLTVDSGNAAPGLRYVALEDVNGEKAHHVRYTWQERGKQIAARDLWISDSPTPLPLKVQGTLPAKEREVSSFSVEFKRWLPDVALDPKVFQFDPQTKAKRAKGFLPDLPPHELLNKPAPAAELELLDGTRTALAAHKGRDIVVLDFWSLSCTPCIGILPKVDAVAKKFKNRGVAFYAMNENDAGSDVRKFFDSRGYGLTATVRNKERNFGAFKVDTIPMMFVVDKAGTIRVVHGVLADDLVAELSEQLEALLAGRELPKPKDAFEKK